VWTEQRMDAVQQARDAYDAAKRHR